MAGTKREKGRRRGREGGGEGDGEGEMNSFMFPFIDEGTSKNWIAKTDNDITYIRSRGFCPFQELQNAQTLPVSGSLIVDIIAF